MYFLILVIKFHLGHIKKNSWLASSPAHKKDPSRDFFFILKTQLLLTIKTVESPARLVNLLEDWYPERMRYHTPCREYI